MSTLTDEAQTEPEAATDNASPRRRPLLLAIGAAAGIAVYALLGLSDLNDSARLVAAVAVVMAVWWVSEALPLAVTALLPLVAFPFIRDLSGEDPTAAVGLENAAAPYANPIVFLYLGGFVVALALQKWNLHRRFALNIVARAGSKPVAIVGGFMLATGLLSMWVNNTATAVMMYPVGLAAATLIRKNGHEDRNFNTALLLGIAYSSAIGSVSTLIGNVPNAFIKAYMEEQYGVTIGFGEWMLAGLPVSIVFGVLAWFILTKVVFRPGITDIPGGKAYFRSELEQLGKMGRAEWTVTIVFALTAVAWISASLLTSIETFAAALPWIVNLDDATIGIAAAILLFMLPADKSGGRILTWEDTKELPWGLLLLFGGGLALSAQITGTGLSAWIGEQLTFLDGVPGWVVVLVIAALILMITEIVSNTATTVTFLPLVAGLAAGFGMEPLMLLIAAGMAANFAFMLPVGTPPNAIVYASGRIRIGDMVRGGALLNLAAVVIITVAVYTVFSWVLL